MPPPSHRLLCARGAGGWDAACVSDKRRGNDWLLGGPGHDTLRGQSCNDLLAGGDGTDRLEGGIGVNRLVTDGADALTWNTHDRLDFGAIDPGAVSATLDWGDGTVEAATVNPESGRVTGSHAYRLPTGGPVTLTVTTVAELLQRRANDPNCGPRLRR